MSAVNWEKVSAIATALGAVATFLAVVVALWGARLQNYFSPPRLSLKVSNREGWRGQVGQRDPVTNKATNLRDVVYYHIRVENERRWNPVHEVHVFLIGIEAPGEKDNFIRLEGVQANLALGWRNDPNPDPKTIGYPAECDLCYIVKENPPEVRLSPIKNRGDLTCIKGKFELILTLQARGIEADTPPLRVLISWNGEWSDDPTKLQRHLVIKEL